MRRLEHRRRSGAYDAKLKDRNEQRERAALNQRTGVLGDAIESFLTSHGVTKEWYIEFKKEHGLPPTCNCDARQEWLNETSGAHPTIANIGVKLLAALTRKKP